MSEKDYDIIETKCNKASYIVAESSYKKSVILMEKKGKFADFDELYKTLIDSKCDLYKAIFFKYWTEHRHMSDYAFEKYFLNKPENYSVFLQGLNSDKFYEEIEMHNYSYLSLLEYLRSVSEIDYQGHMDKVFKNEGSLGNSRHQILSFLRQEKLTEEYKEKLFGYAEKKDINFIHIIQFLSTTLKDMQPMASLLEKTQDYWNTLDNHQRSMYYGYLKRNKLAFKNTNPHFELDEEYNTNINFENVIADFQNKGLIGKNPTLYAFSNIHPYEKGQLLPTLRKLGKENKIQILRLPISPNEAEAFKTQYNINNPDGILVLLL